MVKNKIFIFVSIISTLFVSSCDNGDIIQTPDGEVNIANKEYKDYKDFFLPSLDEFYSMDGKYSVQLYYETCPSCKKTRPYLFRHLEFLKADMKKSKVYIFDMKSKSHESGEGVINRSKFKGAPEGSTKEELINEMIKDGVNKTSDTYYFGVPSLYVIDDHKLVDFYYGTDEITDYYRYLD